MATLDKIKAWTAYELAGSSLADCGTPDSHDSPGAKVLTSVRDSFVEYVTNNPTVRVRRDQLRTDKDAFGYSVSDVYGGLAASSFAAELRPVTPDVA